MNIKLVLIGIVFTFLISAENPKTEIYAEGKEHIFSIKIIKNDEELKLKFKEPFYLIQTGANTNKEAVDDAWELGTEGNIMYLGLEMLGGTINDGQKTMRWNYYDTEFNKIDEEVTGLIENDSLIWLHPPRTKYFKILEINPFPEVLLDKTEWSSELHVGDQWGNKRWGTWEGNLKIASNYKCENEKGKVLAIANTTIGTTELISEFNDSKGFTKLDYKNVDGSRIILEFVEIR